MSTNSLGVTRHWISTSALERPALSDGFHDPDWLGNLGSLGTADHRVHRRNSEG
jgi:hypothetical protein